MQFNMSSKHISTPIEHVVHFTEVLGGGGGSLSCLCRFQGYQSVSKGRPHQSHMHKKGQQMKTSSESYAQEGETNKTSSEETINNQIGQNKA